MSSFRLALFTHCLVLEISIIQVFLHCHFSMERRNIYIYSCKSHLQHFDKFLIISARFEFIQTQKYVTMLFIPREDEYLIVFQNFVCLVNHMIKILVVSFENSHSGLNFSSSELEFLLLA